jgi:hypothetical protein
MFFNADTREPRRNLNSQSPKNSIEGTINFQGRAQETNPPRDIPDRFRKEYVKESIEPRID